METWIVFAFWAGVVVFLALSFWPESYRSAVRRFDKRVAAQDRHWAQRND